MDRLTSLRHCVNGMFMRRVPLEDVTLVLEVSSDLLESGLIDAADALCHRVFTFDDGSGGGARDRLLIDQTTSRLSATSRNMLREIGSIARREWTSEMRCVAIRQAIARAGF